MEECGVGSEMGGGRSVGMAVRWEDGGMWGWQ